MDSRLIQPFVDETIKIFGLMLGAAVKKIGEEMKDSAGSVHHLSGTVGLSGSATGGVVLSMSREAARKIVTRMLGEQVDEMSPEVRDGVGELVNIITARAKRELARQGLAGLRCALPNVVVGEGRRVWLARELPFVSITLVTEEFGPFCLDISIHPVGSTALSGRRGPVESTALIGRRGPVKETRALQAAVAEDTGRYGPETATPGAGTGEGQAAMKILLVDDSVMLRKFVAGVMDDIDDIPIELIQAATGPEALAAVEEHGSSIDLILCDVGIPDIDGLSVIEKVKKTTDARDACVVIITGDVSDETVSRALKAGAAGFLSKPFSQNELVRLVREVHSRLARGLPTATGDGLPLFRPESETPSEPPSDDGQSQNEES